MVSVDIKNNVLIVDAKDWKHFYTIEDSNEMMKLIIENLIANKNVVGIKISNTFEIEYTYDNVKLLFEIVNSYEKIKNELKLLNPLNEFELKDFDFLKPFFNEFEKLVEEIKSDIISAYRKIEILKIRLKRLLEKEYRSSLKSFIENHLEKALEVLQKNTFVKEYLEFPESLKIGERTIYRKLLIPILRPAFLETKFFLLPYPKSIRLEKYKVRDAQVEIFKTNKVRPLYLLTAPEFKLSDEEIKILQRVKVILAEHRPSETEMKDYEKTRIAFYNLEKDLIKKVCEEMKITLKEEEIEKLTQILVRHTVGFGILELLLADEKITDIYVNSPIGETPIFVVHSEFDECETNIYLSIEEAESWATRFRLYSGRPLDEANPVLDTEIEVPGGRARVAAITRTLSPEGLAFAFRRHRDKPWTLPLFIKYKFINPLFAGLISFIVDGGRSILIAGGRGSGKTSLLTAIMLEIPRKYRIIVQEDTLEIPVPQFRKLGYNIERLKSRSVITRVESELPAEEALRTALRLGDSALIIGEIRSKEALTLFEAMRIGALSHVVAGTIHAESAYGVFDRVVNDLKVPRTSFKAVDLIILSANLRSVDGLRRYRRVVEVVEVRKNWEKDPLRENGFAPLMIYNAREDELIPTSTLINGESFIIREIAKRIPEFYNNWELVWDNILLRAKIKETLVKYAEEYNKPELLEANYVSESNEIFHLIAEQVKFELGKIDSNEIFKRWNEWILEKI